MKKKQIRFSHLLDFQEYFPYDTPEMVTSTSTESTKKIKYDSVTDDFIEWVRNVPLESDAVNNLPVCLENYERRKTIWKRVKEFFKYS